MTVAMSEEFGIPMKPPDENKQELSAAALTKAYSKVVKAILSQPSLSQPSNSLYVYYVYLPF